MLARGDGQMKLAVCVKEVPDPSAPRRIDRETLRLDRSGGGVMNEFDAHALEEALRLRDAAEGDGEVVAVSMARAGALDALRKALAMGADRVVLVTDDAAAGSDLLATTQVLARVLEREEPDLVLLGQQGAESVGAVLWASLADRLRLPMISQAATLELADGKARVKRQTEWGYDVIEAPLPCVVAVSDAINEPRYPSLKGIMSAKKKPQETLSLGDLGIPEDEAGGAGSGTEVYGLVDPPSRGDAERIEEGEGAPERIVEYLAARKLL
jgi:electron transfer flavoprotein beta subunit